MAANPINNEAQFAQAAVQHWQDLGQKLKADVEQFKRDGGSASFTQPSTNEYRVSNSDSGLAVIIVADPEDHIVRYNFVSTSNQTAGAPEGGILSMRMGKTGVEFYSSDQPVNADEARGLLLDPVLKTPSA